MKSDKVKKLLIIVVIIIVGYLIFAYIFNKISYRSFIKKHQKVVPVGGKILFRSDGRGKNYGTFILEHGVIKPLGRGKRRFLADAKMTITVGKDAFYIDDLTDKNIRKIPVPKKYASTDFDISPDEKLIVFAGDKEGVVSNLYSINTDGKNLKQLTFFTKEFFPAAYPRFSPDGKYIAFMATKNINTSKPPVSIFVINRDGSGMRELFGERHWGGGYPSWSPDGKKIIFCSHPKDKQKSPILD